MKLDQVFKVENDIASVDIAVTSLGTADLTSEQEKELLANYNKYIQKTILLLLNWRLRM